jgi:hypothetical protein
VPASLFAAVQGVHLRKKAIIVFKGPLVLIMSILSLHIDLDQLENEATPYFTAVATSESYFNYFRPLAC